MPVRHILRMGDPRLLQPSADVTDFTDKNINNLVSDLVDTMRAVNGAGLAAPQIGVPLRVLVYELKTNPRYPDAEPLPLTVLINPSIHIIDEETTDAWEGCLSVPGMRGLVARHKSIRVTAKDQTGKTSSRIIEGFHARVVQHETDHLDGILYPMRIRDLSQFGFITELEESRQIPKVPAE